MKVAIVGAGPRGLWAAEELFNSARERGVSIELTVFNNGARAAASGNGAFQADLPEQWLLNVPAHLIGSQMGTFNAWRGAHDSYPPRREVGAFFAASWDALAGHVPNRCSIDFVDSAVAKVAVAGERVEIDGSFYDEVLLTTGHADVWPGSLRFSVLGELPVIAPAYPASQLDQVADTDIALVRGAALTFIDVVRYARAQTFFPVTRSGRFMEVKAYPSDEQAGFIQPMVEVAEEKIGCAATFADVRSALEALSVDVLKAMGGHGSREDIRTVFEGRDAGDAVEDFRASFEAATGERPWSAATAVGYAFRAAYGAVIERSSFGGRESLGGAQFGQLTATLERVAFGPPPETAGEVLDMIDSGRIRTDVLGRGSEDLEELAQEIGATVVIDAVIAPAGVVEGTLAGDLVRDGVACLHSETGSLMVERDGTLVGQKHIAAAGRMSEGWILGHDTLRRGDHEVIPPWARRVTRSAMDQPERVHGMPPLTARSEPWAQALLADPGACQQAIDEFSSPVNVLNADPMRANVAELVDAATVSGVELKVFFARKANKALTFVDAMRDAGHGVDVASYNELRQVLGRDVPGERIILSAAIKTDELLSLAIDNGVVISADNCDEYDRIAALAGEKTALVAPRLAPDPEKLAPTRFGERRRQWIAHLSAPTPNVRVVGVHAHLHGYAANERRTALKECMELTDFLRSCGHSPEFIDIGGGVPMSYLDSETQWQDYQSAISAQRDGYARAFTWKSDPLTTTYPYYQRPTRGAWLTQVLAGEIGQGLAQRGLRLHLEPGRSLLDGCGVILAQVAFVKTRSDGLPLVGLHMNRTQCRTTSDDFLIDPVLVKNTPDTEELEAFLVGAYCIEDEVILRRKIRFPRGVSAGDIIAIENTAGYFMHILESASHQIPLARNVLWPDRQLDLIDQPVSLGAREPR